MSNYAMPRPHTNEGAVIMNRVQARERMASVRPDQSEERSSPDSARPSIWQLNLLRVGYLVTGVGLAVFKWPLLFNHGPWELKEGTVQCMLVAMSILALLGVRHPLRMLPILLFEVGWKLLWLGVVALPLWSANKLDSATGAQVGEVLWVVIIIVVIPWHHVLTQYVVAPREPWRRSR